MSQIHRTVVPVCLSSEMSKQGVGRASKAEPSHVTGGKLVQELAEALALREYAVHGDVMCRVRPSIAMSARISPNTLQNL